MAIQKLVEPYVKVRENIRETPNLLDIDGTSNIGGVIVAPTGPRLAYVAGPKDFLNKYTVDGSIPRNADRSLINAYYLSFSSGLVIARAMNTTAVSGLVFLSKQSTELKILIEELASNGFWGLEVNSKFYWCNPIRNDWDQFITTLSGLKDDDEDYMISQENLTSIKKFTESNRVYCKDFKALADALSSDTTSVIYDETIPGLIVSGAKLALGKLTPLLNLVEQVGTAKIGLEAKEVLYKNGLALTDTYELKLTGATYKDGTEKFSNNFAFAIGTMAYYCGAIDKSKYADYSLVNIKSINDLLNSLNGLNGLTAELKDLEEGGRTDEMEDAEEGVADRVITLHSAKGNALTIVEGSCTGIAPVISSVADSSYGDPTSDDVLFGIYPNDPQDHDLYRITIKPDENNLFYIELFNGSETNGYTVSLLADELDQSGSNCFIENLNALGLGFTFITNPNFKTATESGEEALMKCTPKSTQVFSFGDSGLDLSASSSVTAKTNALYALEDQELYDIEYLAPMGITDLQFIKAYILVGKNNDWFAPVDIPFDKTNANTIKGYFLNVDLTSNSQGMGPFDKNTGLTGWMNYIAATTLFYSRVMANKAANCEFAPVFDKTNGILDYTNPCYMLGKAEREQLLNLKAPVNFVKFDQRTNLYFMNDNWTHQPQHNVVSEEQNRRLVNKIKKDVNRIMQSFKGRFNTTSTRADVVTMLNYYFRSQILSMRYTIDAYEIICDESNNPAEVISANKLGVTVRVRLNHSIKYVDVLVDVYPIGVDFTN